MKRALATAAVLAFTASCTTLPTASETPAADPAPRPAVVNHPVFFKLKDPAQADELIADCDRLLATIPMVTSYYCGRHLDIGRDTVTADYDVGAYVGFASVEDYRAYIDHPQHVELVNKWRPRLQWLRVYDVLDETE